MDLYFRKTRRPVADLSGPSKTYAPVKKRLNLEVKKPTGARRELFKQDKVHPLEKQEQSQDNLNLKPIAATPIRPIPKASPTTPAKPVSDQISTTPTKLVSKSILNTTKTPSQISKPLEVPPPSPIKISKGPLKGVSTSLLDHIRAKEAASKATTPEEKRQKELLGIAPDIARIVPTIFIANKREVMLYDKVVEKCFKGLRSNYTTATIIECLDLMDKVAPEWVSVVTISKGTFMRINKDKYTMPQLFEAIKRFSRQTKN